MDSSSAADEELATSRSDCECNPIHRLTFSCGYKIELCTFASYSEKFRPYTNHAKQMSQMDDFIAQANIAEPQKNCLVMEYVYMFKKEQ
jgi:hypothetical protein